MIFRDRGRVNCAMWHNLNWQSFAEGCEAHIGVGQDASGNFYRRKVFFRRRDFDRSIFMYILLRHSLDGYRYCEYINVPKIQWVCREDRIVISDFVDSASVKENPDAQAALVKTKMALICMGGELSCLIKREPGRVMEYLENSNFLTVTNREQGYFMSFDVGFDLHDSNYVYDGAKWWVIDF